MNDFYLVDDDGFNMFDDIREEKEICIIAPMSFMKRMIFWILGEDDKANPGVIMVDTDNDAIDEDSSPYLLCYVPGVEFDLGPFGFSIEGFDGPVFIYDRLSSSYLADLDEETAIPFHYKSEDQDEETIIQEKKSKVSSFDQDKKDIEWDEEDEEDDDENKLTGFSENISNDDGSFSSYSFYSTDKDLVERVANHRSEIINMMTKRKE